MLGEGIEPPLTACDAVAWPLGEPSETGCPGIEPGFTVLETARSPLTSPAFGLAVY